MASDKFPGHHHSMSSVGPCYLKLLVSNVVAGSIIGPKGSTISDIHKTTECTIRLSNTNCYFPRTIERVVAMWGTLEQIKAAFEIVLEKVRGAPPSEAMGGPGVDLLSCKIVVPNSAVSQLIGKQGQAIKELQENTSTRIQISNRDEQYLKERVVAISGAYEAVRKAALIVVETIQSDPHLKDHTDINYVIPSAVAYPQSMGSPSSLFQGKIAHESRSSFRFASGNDLMTSMHPINAGYGPYYNTQFGYVGTDGSVRSSRFRSASNTPRPPPEMRGLSSVNSMNEVTRHVDLADSFIGFTIGKQGITLKQIQQQSGTKIRISAKGEFVPGTTNRRVTITGSQQAVQLAEYLLREKVSEIEAESWNAIGS